MIYTDTKHFFVYDQSPDRLGIEICVIVTMLKKTFVNEHRHRFNYLIARKGKSLDEFFELSRFKVCHIKYTLLYILRHVIITFSPFNASVAMTTRLWRIFSKVLNQVFLTTYFIVIAIGYHCLNARSHSLLQGFINTLRYLNVFWLLARCCIDNIRSSLARHIMQNVQAVILNQRIIYCLRRQIVTIGYHIFINKHIVGKKTSISSQQSLKNLISARGGCWDII